MSKLPNAPLVEVVFELRWDINSKSDLVDFQYLHGDLYSSIKDSFPIRENLVPPDIPFEALKAIPVFRFRKSNNSYPLIQIGPGVISFNTVDEFYEWENFRDEVNLLIDKINEIYPKFDHLSKKTSLIYIDFIKDTGVDEVIDDWTDVRDEIVKEYVKKYKLTGAQIAKIQSKGSEFYLNVFGQENSDVYNPEIYELAAINLFIHNQQFVSRELDPGNALINKYTAMIS